MNPWIIVFSAISYLGFLFLLAWKAQRWSWLSKSNLSAWIYPLSMGVYCTAWTYYGSVGKASKDGIEFLAVYIGPTLMAPLWWIILRKIIRISAVQRTTTIADFISSRYGKNISIGSIVTIMCFIGIIPYISLQIKAISESFDIITQNQFARNSGNVLRDTSWYVVCIMALFTLLFGVKKMQTTERHEGMMAAIAFESVVKLLAFLIVGAFITYGIFNGLGDIFSKAMEGETTKKLLTMTEGSGYREWFWITILSALAFTLLPRQFQVSVVENTNENHLKSAMWMFPIYLLLINLFVLPIALGGMIIFPNTTQNADYFILNIPLHYNQNGLALLTFIGGISAATSMIIVETLALSTMFSNNLLIPLLVGNDKLKDRFAGNLSEIRIWSRRACILLILFLAYSYYHQINKYYSLVSIGLISFVSVAQFSPAMLGGIFWKKGTKAGAIASILVGFTIWAYCLVIPSLIGGSEAGQAFINEGPFGLNFLKPGALFGLEGFSPISHAMFWSMFFNLATYILVSINTTQSVLEKNQSEIFVDIFKYSAIYESTVVLKGKASLPDLEQMLSQFFGVERTKQVLRLFAKKHDIDISDSSKPVDHRLIAYSERLLSGVIGSASARIMLSTIVAEEEIKLDEVVNILKESQQIISNNRELTRKSTELKNALTTLASMNDRLKENDQLKDDFLSTVTHELRTPITSIRAFSEILYDNPDLDSPDRQHYLGIVIKETERISRLISQVLDLEKYESGRQKLTLSKVTPLELIIESLEAIDQLLKDKNTQIVKIFPDENPVFVCDKDKIIQVLLNLLSNALKFADEKNGVITIQYEIGNDEITFHVSDNGKGVEQEYQTMIFEKFFQAKNQLVRKPIGNGLGLAICKKIIDLHKGNIKVENKLNEGANFSFSLSSHLENQVTDFNNHS